MQVKIAVIKVGNKSFERMDHFKYLATALKIKVPFMMN